MNCSSLVYTNQLIRMIMTMKMLTENELWGIYILSLFVKSSHMVPLMRLDWTKMHLKFTYTNSHFYDNEIDMADKFVCELFYLHTYEV